MTEGNFITVDSGRILVLAHLFFIVSLTRQIEIAVGLRVLGFHGKMLFEGKYVIPSGTTYCKTDIHVYKGVIQETTHCEWEYVCTMSLL